MTTTAEFGNLDIPNAVGTWNAKQVLAKVQLTQQDVDEITLYREKALLTLQLDNGSDCYILTGIEQLI